jgi:hypothetical protein
MHRRPRFDVADALKIGEIVALTLGENPDFVAVVAAYLLHYVRYGASQVSN